MDCRYDFTFYKNMKTEVPLHIWRLRPSNFVKFPLFDAHLYWDSSFYKKCVFCINQYAPRFFATYFQQFACFCCNLHVSSRCQCIMWFSMVLNLPLKIYTWLWDRTGSFLNGLLLLDEIQWNLRFCEFWHQNVTPLSQVIFRLISSKSQFFQRIWNQFQEAELHRNQNKTVKNASCNTLCLLDFPNIEQTKFRKHEISLLGGPAIMFSKSWNQWKPFGIWSEIWRKTRFWTFLVNPKNRAEQCEKI